MRLVALLALVACGDSSSSAPRQEAPKTVPSTLPSDAAVVAPVAGSAVVPTTPTTPTTEDDIVRPAQPQSPTGAPTRPGRPIDVTLRSTPAGAQVAVDGTVIGNTPAYWLGTADGREHEFLFTMKGYAIARYRFVPLVSGVVHGRLDRITDDLDAGVAPPPEVVPQRHPQGPMITPPAPPTITPDAAAPTEPTMPGLGPHP